MAQTEPTFQQNPAIVRADVSGETVLMDIGSGACIEIDEIGTNIWNLLVEPHNQPSLVAALMQKFDVDQEVCSANTDAFLQYLAEHHFLIVSDAP